MPLPPPRPALPPSSRSPAPPPSAAGPDSPAEPRAQPRAGPQTGPLEHRLLRQPTRRALFETIAARPGLLAASLARALGRDARTVAYHLGLLEGAGLVEAVHEGGRRWFAPSQALTPAERARCTALQRATRARILALVEARGGTSLGELVRELGLAKSTVSSALSALARDGLVEKHRAPQGLRVLRVAPRRRPGSPL